MSSPIISESEIVSDDREKLCERWRAAKAAQRARLPRCQSPNEPQEDFIRLVLAERDVRLDREYKMWSHPDLVTHAYRYTLLTFSADVWAAKVVLEEQYGSGRATPTKIVNWLWANDLSHGCKKSSLRTMVYRAFEKILRLEAEPYLYDRNEPVWPKFSLELALKRHNQSKSLDTDLESKR